MPELKYLRERKRKLLEGEWADSSTVHQDIPTVLRQCMNPVHFVQHNTAYKKQALTECVSILYRSLKFFHKLYFLPQALILTDINYDSVLLTCT